MAARAPASPEAIQKGKQLIEKVVQAVGGPAIDALTSYREAGSMAMPTPQGEMELKTTLIVALPDRIRQEIVVPIGTIAMVVTPTAAFVQTPQGSKPLPPSERVKIEKDVRRAPVFLLRHRKEPGFMVSAAGAGKVGDVAVEQLSIEFAGDRATWSVDPATGRVLAQTYRGEGPSGAPGEIVDTYSDFRTVDGVTVPFKVVSTFNGEPGSSGVTTAVEINKPVDASLFEAPKPAAAKP
jgi:hypothetical protein